MQKCKLALFLFAFFVAITLMAVGSVSAEDKLVCPSQIGDIPLDWRDEHQGYVVVQSNGVYKAVCTYPYNFRGGSPTAYASILVQWCEEPSCGDVKSYSAEFTNAVESEQKQALVAEMVTNPDHPQFIAAAQDFQEAKMNLLGQAEERAVLKGESETYDPIMDKYNLPPVPDIPEGFEKINTLGLTPWATVERIEGEVFVSRGGTGKWQGPITANTDIFQGDVIYTNKGAQAIFRGYSLEYDREGQRGLWIGGAGITGDTMMFTGIKEMGWLKWGAISVWRRIITGDVMPPGVGSDSYDSHSPRNIPRAQGGFFTINTTYARSAPRGTEYIVEVDKETQIATYTVKEGIVEVWLKDDPSIKIELGAGESARATETSFEDNPYDWDALLEKYDWSDIDLSEASEEEIEEFTGLIFESRSKASGSSFQIPLTLNGVREDIGNMDMTLRYDSSVLAATEVVKGGLTSDSLFDYNIIDGTIKISLADKDGFRGDGSIAYVRFDVIGAEGSSSSLDIASLSANRADLTTLDISSKDGVFRVISPGENMGDCNGDEKITSLDALCALQMTVGKIPEDLNMDMNGDGSVTSLDAREILRIAAGPEE